MNQDQTGLLAEFKVKSDLMSKGFYTATPDNPLSKFDLICSDTIDFIQIWRVQVKTEKEYHRKPGTSLMRFYDSNYQKKSHYCKPNYTINHVDVFAFHIQEIDTCVYVSSKMLLENNKYNFRIRWEPTKNNSKQINWYEDYLEFPKCADVFFF